MYTGLFIRALNRIIEPRILDTDGGIHRDVERDRRLDLLDTFVFFVCLQLADNIYSGRKLMVLITRDRNMRRTSLSLTPPK